MIHIYDRKLDTFEDLMEGVNVKPVQIAFWYKSYLKRIKDKFDVEEPKTSGDFKNGIEVRFL